MNESITIFDKIVSEEAVLDLVEDIFHEACKLNHQPMKMASVRVCLDCALNLYWMMMPMTKLKSILRVPRQNLLCRACRPIISDNTYWVVEEEREEWYRVSGMPTAIMLINGGKAVCHGEVGVRHGRVVK